MQRFLTRDKGRYTFAAIVLLWIIYAVSTIMAPSRGNTFSLSGAQMIAVQLSVAIPVLLVWLAAAYGAVRFKQYAILIKDSPDGRALDVLTNGLFVLIASYLTSTFIGVFVRYSVGSPWIEPLVGLRNHLPILISLVALWLIFRGSSLLARQAKAKFTLDSVLVIMVPFVLLAALFSAFFYSHISHEIVNGVPNFALPGKWPFVTMALPYLIVWLLGLLSIVNISFYIKHVKGTIYRKSLRYLVMGLVAVLGFSILLQLTVLSGNAFSKLGLAPILLLVYAILILYGLGFVLISVGARKLTRIEAIQ